MRLSLGRSPVVAAVDVGATKIACFILTSDGIHCGDRTLTTAGFGYVQSRGVRGGGIVDTAEASRAIGEAVEIAEARARVNVKGVTVVTACGQLASHRLSAKVHLGGRPITDADQARAVSQALATLKLNLRKPIHMRPITWSVDGRRVLDPRSVSGRALGLEMVVVSMKEGVHQTLAHCVEQARLQLDGVVAAPYAAGLAALTDDEMELGSICIDMGGGSTSVAVFTGGSLIHVDSLAVGGAHVTKDVAEGLSTSLAGAERVKTLYGSAIASRNEDRKIIMAPPRGDDPGADPVEAPRSMLMGIIAPRIEETLETVKHRLRAAGALEPRAGVVLIGCASQLPGVREVAMRVFDRPVRPGWPGRAPRLADSATGPGFCAAVGVLQRAAFGPAELASSLRTGAALVRRPIDPNANMVVKAASWFWEHF